jgi:CheY-like chemotaxis protein
MPLKILIVDDEEITRDMLSKLLVKEGYEAKAVESGEKAIETIKETDFDIVFSDLKMPGMDGIEVLSTIKKLKPSIFVIMITAFATIETAVESMKLGAYDYIRKPFRLEHIQEIIYNIGDDIQFRNSIEELNFTESKKDKSCFEVYEKELEGSKGLVITSEEPHEIEKKYGLKNAEYIWLTPKSEKKNEVHPQNLYKLGESISSFLDDNKDPVILICGIEYLIKQHDWEIMMRFLNKTSRRLIDKNSRLIISVNPAGIDDSILSSLQELISTINAKLIANILSNPIRREIIRFIHQNDKTSFTSIFNNLEMDDSSKLSFHLRKLSSEKIISKDKEKKYSLRRRGRIAANILKQMENKSISDTENLISLIMG